MKTKFLIKTLATAAALTGLATSSHAITIGDTFDTGDSVDLWGIPFAVDYGTVEYVSDLSNGALRFNNKLNTQSTSITSSNLVIDGLTELAFDWSVFDDSDMTELSSFTINEEESIFHDGIGRGNPTGTVSRFLDTGVYDLSIISATTNLNLGSYLLTVSNLRLNPLESPDQPDQDPLSDVADVPDSSLGFLGIATIFAVLGAGRRFATKKAAE